MIIIYILWQFLEIAFQAIKSLGKVNRGNYKETLIAILIKLICKASAGDCLFQYMICQNDLWFVPSMYGHHSYLLYNDPIPIHISKIKKDVRDKLFYE